MSKRIELTDFDTGLIETSLPLLRKIRQTVITSGPAVDPGPAFADAKLVADTVTRSISSAVGNKPGIDQEKINAGIKAVAFRYEPQSPASVYSRPAGFLTDRIAGDIATFKQDPIQLISDRFFTMADFEYLYEEDVLTPDLTLVCPLSSDYLLFSLYRQLFLDHFTNHVFNVETAAVGLRGSPVILDPATRLRDATFTAVGTDESIDGTTTGRLADVLRERFTGLKVFPTRMLVFS